MRISLNGLKLIEQSEGFRPMPYQDVAGVWTVGYGHRILMGEYFNEGITHQEAEQLLAQDVAHAEASVSRLAPEANQNQFDALADFTYNLGVGPLQTMLAHGWENVPQELPLWVYADHVVQPGLVTRRAAEVALFTAPC